MKHITIAAVLACVASLTFAQNIAMSTGGKLEFVPVWTNMQDGKETTTISQNNLAFGAFFDAVYAQVGIDYIMSMGKQKIDYGISSYSKYKVSMLGLSLLGKYPIAVNGKVTAFPMVGFQYNRVIYMEFYGEEITEDDVLADASDFYLLLGGGADIALSGLLYVRPSALYGISMTAEDGDLGEIYDPVFGSTLKLGVSVGYKF